MLNRYRYSARLKNVRSWTVLPSRSLVLAAILTTVGCGNILGIGDIESCWDASGFDGHGCYRTTGGCKLTKEQLPNACTESTCVPFDNLARLGLSAAADLPKVLVGGPGDIAGPGPGGTDNCPMNDRVIVTGSNAIVPIVTYVGAELAQAQNPVTVLYQSQSSCNGAAAIFKDVKVAGEFLYWTRQSGALIENKCTLPEKIADIGVSDVFGTTCGFDEDSTIALDAQAPIQAMIFVAPKTSPERAISAEAARLVYGYGGTYKKKFNSAPWTNLNNIQRRNPTSGTQNLIGAFIGVPSTSFVGVENTGTTAMISSVQKPGSAADAAATIGILDVVNGDPMDVRVSLRVLAFQAEDQHCAFHPDSDEGKLDKRNVRDGHYALWGPIHVYSRPNPASNVANVVNYLSLDDAPTTAGKDPDQTMSELIKIVAGAFLVPSCAMRVQRTSDGGSLLPQLPARSCACYFDQLTRTTGESTCASCTVDADCASPDAPRCNFGFCEQQ